MSWQPWADNIISHGFKQAALCGQQGGSWAKSAGFEPQNDEIIKIAQAFNDPSGIRVNGLWVAGVKYFALGCDDEVLLGKHQDMGVICIKTKLAIVIGVHDSSLQAGEANVKLNKVATSLKEAGY